MMRDLVDVSSMNEPDPGWLFVDAAGHEHRWVGEWQHSTLPTCRIVIDHEHIDDCGTDGWCPRPTSHYECIECGDRVEPRRRPSPCRRYISIGLIR